MCIQYFCFCQDNSLSTEFESKNRGPPIWPARFEARRLWLSPSGRERRAIAFDGAPGRACADLSQERMDEARKVAAVKDMRCDSRAPRRFDVAAGRANEERPLAQDRPFVHGLEEKV
jgi:hypothetical protein